MSERGRPFKRGQSGNPPGRPKGILDKRVSVRELFEGHREALVAKAIEKALEGDTAALRICLERIAPPIKASAAPVIMLDLPNSGDLADYGRGILAAIGKGEVPPDVGTQLLQGLSAQARVIEQQDLERRIAALEGQTDENS